MSASPKTSPRHAPPPLRGLLPLTAALLLVVSCERRELSPAQRGERTFMRHCSSCHGPDGKGRPMPGLPTPPRDLTDTEFQRSHSDAQLRDVLLNGKGNMPPLGKLMQPEELDELIAYMRSLPLR